MYHASLVWDVCDLLNLARLTGVPELATRVSSWMLVVERGLQWLEAMSHPDMDISFFNDAAFGIAPSLDRLKEYSMILGCEPHSNRKLSAPCVRHLKESGYVVIFLDGNGKAILDVGRVGPDYQPGHAHADTLSFELSLFGQRVLVNSGTSQY